MYDPFPFSVALQLLILTVLSIGDRILQRPDHDEISRAAVQRSPSHPPVEPPGDLDARWRGTSNSLADELVQALSSHFADVDRTLDWLLKFAIAIRKSASQSRDVKAEKFDDPTDPGYRTFREATGQLLGSFRLKFLYRRATFAREQSGQRRLSQDDIAEVKLALEEENMPDIVSSRIIDENLRRRKRFLYIRSHDEHFRRRPEIQRKAQDFIMPSYDLPQRPEPARDVDQLPAIQTQVLEEKHEATAGTYEPQPLSVKGESTVPKTTASSIDAAQLDATGKGPARARSVVSAPAAAVQAQYPRIPKDALHGKTFKCPYCCLPVEISGSEQRERELRWKYAWQETDVSDRSPANTFTGGMLSMTYAHTFV